MKTFSQKNETLIIKKLLINIFSTIDYSALTIVDVGAYDGVLNSNSYEFIKKGAKAILIEPNKLTYKKLISNLANLNNTNCENIACSNFSQSTKLFLGTDSRDSMFSTICRDNNSWFEYSRSNKYQITKVKKLDQILKKYKFPIDFDVLSIDTEGNDFEVLEGMKNYFPKIIITEEYRHNLNKHKSKYALLTQRGYVLVAEVGCNTIWINSQYFNKIISTVDIRKQIIDRLNKNSKKLNTSFISYKKISKILSSNLYKITLIKSPKWSDDALLVRISGKGIYQFDWTIKLHEDKYPIASHIYNSEAIIFRVTNSSFAAKIHITDIINCNEIPLRVVIYDYIEGVPLSKFIHSANSETVNLGNSLLKKCIRNLIIYSRVNPFVRDLGDFMVTTDASGNKKILLTDYNNLMDCSESSEYSRKNIFDILNPVIDSLVNSNCELFEKSRPRLTDVSNMTSSL